MAKQWLHDRLVHAGFQRARYRGFDADCWGNLEKCIVVFSQEWRIQQKRVWICVDFRDNYAKGFGSESAACEHALERAERSA